MPLPPAAKLQQRYRIVRTIGSGGMGTVYLAEDMRLGGRLCAVKEHRPDPSLDAVDLAKLRRQFEQREARILAELDHPSLPKVFDYFTEDGSDYLVMEYVAGDNLSAELERHLSEAGRPLPEKVVLIWAKQVLDALHYLHTRPTGAIIHRDIKPANIILTAEGRTKLVDFGLAKLVAPLSAAAASRSIQLLTPEYAPPEQFIASLGPMDERSDVFSFGATLYHLLTGTSPPSAQERAFGAAAMVPAPERYAEVSSATGEALMRACALKKEERFGSASELRRALGTVRVKSRKPLAMHSAQSAPQPAPIEPQAHVGASVVAGLSSRGTAIDGGIAADASLVGAPSTHHLEVDDVQAAAPMPQAPAPARSTAGSIVSGRAATRDIARLLLKVIDEVESAAADAEDVAR